MAGISSKAAGKLENKSKFGGKELESKEFSDGSGLELYDFGARNLDPQIGRWHSKDPLAEKAYSLTPYRYSFNNPLLFVDPDGRWEFQIGQRQKTLKDKEGNALKDDKGNAITETEYFLKLVAQKGDDINTLAEQTGLKREDLEKIEGFKDLGENSFVEDMGGLLNFKEINRALNLSDYECASKNNCHGMSFEFAYGESISTNGKNNMNGRLFSTHADNEYKKNFISVENPKSGDLVRFAQDDMANNIRAKDVGGINHSAVFLLKNGQGTQVFTKNGYKTSIYSIAYTNQPANDLGGKSILQSYGNPTALKGDKSPYYRKK